MLQRLTHLRFSKKLTHPCYSLFCFVSATTMMTFTFPYLPTLLAISCVLTFPTNGFIVKPTTTKTSIVYQTENNKDIGPDLFDFFDPLRSPHSYPNGIVQPGSRAKDSKVVEDEHRDPLRLSIIPRDNIDPLHQKGAPVDPAFFDPTISPHAYRNGTPDTLGGDKRAIQMQQQRNDVEMVNYSPFRLTKVQYNKVEPIDPSRTTSVPDVFDPLLSPHAYPNGTPNKLVVDQPKLGILLMDHGSRNQASNDRLHELAKIFQNTVASHIVVTAAHMELASPNIPEGLKVLIEKGVDEIVCHPYFLSANGRHVSEDIPEIILGAIEAMNIKIPVVTTEPVGSQTDIMIEAIQKMVQQHSSILKSSNLG